MDYLIQFRKSEKQTDFLNQTVQVFSSDIGLVFAHHETREEDGLSRYNSTIGGIWETNCPLAKYPFAKCSITTGSMVTSVGILQAEVT